MLINLIFSQVCLTELLILDKCLERRMKFFIYDSQDTVNREDSAV